jgi:hypothetical protein
MKNNLFQIVQILNLYMIYHKIIMVSEQIMCGSTAKGKTELQYMDGFTVSDPDLNCTIAPHIGTNSKLSNCF